MDEENLEQSDLENEFDDDDGKIYFEEQSHNSSQKNAKKTLYDFDEDSDDEDEAVDSELDMASDLGDEQEYLPDDKAWGQKRKSYYNTDFDKDYIGSYGAEDAEIAEMEEQEARKIQKRLLEQMSEADFSLGDAVEHAAASSQTAEIIQADLSSLSKRQQLELFYKESPEFKNLVEDFELKMKEIRERIQPVLNLITSGKLKKSPAGSFLETKLRIILNYCTNIIYYVLLKTKKLPVKNHPVLKSLFRYRQLLLQMQPVEDDIIAPQVDKILEVFGSDEMVDAKRKKQILKILRNSSVKKPKISTEATENEAAMEAPGDVNDVNGDSSGDSEEEANADNDKKRAITYEMAKNKGLTPKRSKEQRNPRVKHRNKFRKSIIRRRGQVRTARTEIPVYGGEPTGIKIGLKKGRKFAE